MSRGTIMLTAARGVPRSIYARIVHMLVWHSTTWLELVCAIATGSYSLGILLVVPPATRRLLGDVSISFVASFGVVLGGLWILAVMWHGWPGGKKMRVRLCQFMAGAGFVFWFYMVLDIGAVAGLRPLAVLLIILYCVPVLGAAVSWVRCLFVLREWTMRTAGPT